MQILCSGLLDPKIQKGCKLHFVYHGGSTPQGRAREAVVLETNYKGTGILGQEADDDELRVVVWVQYLL